MKNAENLLKKTQEKLDAQIAEETEHSRVVSGVRGAFMNRFHGLQHAPKLLKPAQEGLLWVNYFARCPEKELDADVHAAGAVWFKDKLTPTFSLHSVRMLAINSVAYIRGDGDKIHESAKTLAMERTKNLAANTGVSIAVAQALRMVGTASRTEFIRQTARYARGTWQVSGVMGVIYGLARIHDALSDPELSKFSTALKQKRDAFNKCRAPKADFDLNRIKECKESEPPAKP